MRPNAAVSDPFLFVCQVTATNVRATQRRPAGDGVVLVLLVGLVLAVGHTVQRLKGQRSAFGTT